MKFTLNNQQIFPAGTTVKAFLKTNWAATIYEPAGAPLGAATAEAVVDASGNATFEALASETNYWAAAEIGGVWRYVKFRTANPKATAKGLQATAGEGAPGELTLGAFYIQQTAGKNVALWRGKGAGEAPELVTNLGNELLTPASFAGAYIDGAVGTPSLRTLLAALAADNTHAPTAEAVLKGIGLNGLGSRFSVDGWGSGSGSFVPTAKIEYWLPVKITRACKLTGLTYQVGAVANGKVVVAAYNAAGERKAVSAEVAQGAIEQPQRIPFAAPWEITEPQIIWVSIIFESATGTCMGAFNLNPAKKEAQAEFLTPAAVVLPAEPIAAKSPFLLTY
jgi:hypothetical protein